jgi:choline kinase
VIAIILAAGVGKRLHGATGGRPKCLVEIGGKSLLRRLLESLVATGVGDVVVVTGFGDEAVRAAIGAGPPGVSLRWVLNPRFREGAILSLWAAREALNGPVLVMDADVLCPTALLARLVASPHANCFLMDASVANTGEEQMLLVREGRVRDIVRGGAPGWELSGESIGFLKLDAAGARLLRGLLDARVAKGDTGIEHEQVYPELLARVDVGYERVDGMPWTEIDFVEDIMRAETEVLPRMAAAEVPPTQVLMQLTTGVWTAQALWAAACLGVADHLSAGPRTREELAAATGTLPGPLYRLLRALASLGVFTEQADGRLANTPSSELLRTDVPGSVRDYVRFSGQPWHLASHGAILHSLRTGKPAGDHVLGKSLWDFFASNPEEGTLFNAAMTGIIAATALEVRDAYDFTGFGTLVDVGGGHGFLLGTVLAANPALRGVLFDQPHVVGGAGSTFDRLGVRDRVTIVGGDFFREVPRAGAYVMSHIIHDWDDQRATAILRTIRRAAEPGATLLLAETVIPAGNAPSFGKILDLEMLVLPGGVERTEAEYRALLAAGGFRLTRVLPTRSASHVVEAVAEPA